jgi:hypothetical protein
LKKPRRRIGATSYSRSEFRPLSLAPELLTPPGTISAVLCPPSSLMRQIGRIEDRECFWLIVTFKGRTAKNYVSVYHELVEMRTSNEKRGVPRHANSLATAVMASLPGRSRTLRPRGVTLGGARSGTYVWTTLTVPSCSRSFESRGNHSALNNQTTPFSVALLTWTACEKAGRFTVLAGSRQFIAHSMPLRNQPGSLRSLSVAATRTIQAL